MKKMKVAKLFIKNIIQEYLIFKIKIQNKKYIQLMMKN